jgi:hypothetical protein
VEGKDERKEVIWCQPTIFTGSKAKKKPTLITKKLREAGA